MASIRTLLLCVTSSALLATSAVAQPVLEGGRKLHADLSGATSGGDPDGSGSATIVVNPGQRRVCFNLEVSGIAPATAAHIHYVSNNGLAVGLEAPTDGDSQGCIDGVSRDLALSILTNPQDFYVNIHNADYPAGAIRGTLDK